MTRERWRILFVAPYLPFPPQVGFSIRVFHLLRELASRHDVTLLAYGGANDAARREGIRALGVQLRVVDAPRRIGAPDSDAPVPATYAWGLRLLQLGLALTPVTYQGGYLWSRALQHALDTLLATQHFDLVQLETSELHRIALPSGTRLIVDELNVEFALRRRFADAQSSPARRIYNQFESLKFRREERRCWRRADGVIAVSDQDAHHMRRLEPAARVLLVPNGVDLERYHPSGDAPVAGSLLFVGRMDYAPNLDAVTWFARDILPRIRRRRPEAILTIVGGPVTPALARLAGEAVRVIGRAPDVLPYLSAASVLPVPLRVGGGTRLKILEGLAMARPIVSTAIGCEGLHTIDREHLLVANTADEFADATVRLLDDADLRQRLGRAGRVLVEREYDWHVIGRQLESAYAQVLSQANARTRVTQED